jgi:histidyl-tRNA synthetase
LGVELDHFIGITDLLDAVECVYDIDVTFTPGFEYYTGLCFQFTLNGQKIGGGGRYNDLIPLTGGKNTSACGFALYVNRLMSMVKPKQGEAAERGIQINGLSKTPDVIKNCLELAGALHELGYIAELDFSGRSATWRWLVNVNSQEPFYIVADQKTGSTKEAGSTSSVINIIGGSS